MRCPYCGADESKVIDSRPTEDNERKDPPPPRVPLTCKKRFTTYEMVETVPLMVIKKDRSREVFDRQKLFNGMLRACEKRPVSYESWNVPSAALSSCCSVPTTGRCPASVSGSWPWRTEKDGRGCLYALCFGLPPVQRCQHLYG